MYPVIRLPHTDVCNIVRRENRFVVRVLVRGSEERAYITNTGRLRELLISGKKGYCIRSTGVKTNYRLIAVEDNNLAALIDTKIQEDTFKILVRNNKISWLRNCVIVKRAPRLNKSVLDYLLECNGKTIYVEIKSAVMRYNRVYAMYPDCPSLRGRRHIRELITHVENGGYGVIVFIAALPHIKYFKPNRNADAVIATLLQNAHKVGVLIKAINIVYDPESQHILLLNDDLPVIL